MIDRWRQEGRRFGRRLTVAALFTLGTVAPALADPPGLVEAANGLWTVGPAAESTQVSGALFVRGVAPTLAAEPTVSATEEVAEAPIDIPTPPVTPPRDEQPILAEGPVSDVDGTTPVEEGVPVIQSSAIITVEPVMPLPPALPDRPENVNAGRLGYGNDGVITVAVFGDSLAEGIWGSLYRALERDHRFRILKRARHSTGFSRPDYYNWEDNLAQFLSQDEIDIAVFSVGFNDVQSLYYPEGGNPRFGTDAWSNEYSNRVEAAMDMLIANDVPTFWMGLPITRSESFADSIASLNAIYRQEAEGTNIRFISTWEVSTNAEGVYSAYLPDSDGRERNVRANDGIHFTTRGYDRLMQHLLGVMRQEIAAVDEALASIN